MQSRAQYSIRPRLKQDLMIYKINISFSPSSILKNLSCSPRRGAGQRVPPVFPEQRYILFRVCRPPNLYNPDDKLRPQPSKRSAQRGSRNGGMVCHLLFFCWLCLGYILQSVPYPTGKVSKCSSIGSLQLKYSLLWYLLFSNNKELFMYLLIRYKEDFCVH